MVNLLRRQSGLAPRTRCCRAMRPPLFAFHFQTRSTKASRPRSWRVLPSRWSCRSTTVWVAMPAWSIPGCQRVLKPSIRWKRMSASSRVQRCAWPMCSEPVTLGGGMGMTYAGRVSAGSSMASKTPLSSQNAYQRDSTWAGS